MNAEALFDFVKENWRNKAKLSFLVGQFYAGTTDRNDQNHVTFNWGAIPTEKAVITLTDGIITRIQTWSGLNWSARYGWGDAFVDTSMETYRNG